MKEMSVVEHLEELRNSVVKILLILVVAFFVCYAQGDIISEFLLRPLRHALGNSTKGEIVYLGVLDKMLAQIQVALWAGVILSAPLWFYQIWRFIRPGLYDHESRRVGPFLLVGLLLFWCGVGFGHFVAIPLVFQALMDIGASDIKAMIDMKDYLVLASRILVLMGLVFQLPNFMLILGFMGLIRKQQLVEFRPYIYVGLAVVAAIFSAPDVISMMVVFIPLMFLFEVGVVAVAWIVHPYQMRRAKEEQEEEEHAKEQAQP